MGRTFLALVMAASGAAAAPTSASPGIPPLPRPAEFVQRIDNKWFPLIPGTVLVYRGEKDGMSGRDVMTVTHRHRTILGIRATVVSDRLYLRGHLAERTADWYAQDRHGNVWYLGESTEELDAGGRTTNTEGSWEAGVHGARAGIYMPAHPMPGESGRQEYYKGHAEDQYKILSVHARVSTPAASSRHALLTEETTRLEPGSVDHKLYVAGVGTVVEQSVKRGNEKFVLSSARPRSRPAITCCSRR
jgi:hypothetical protein